MAEGRRPLPPPQRRNPSGPSQERGGLLWRCERLLGTSHSLEAGGSEQRRTASARGGGTRAGGGPSGAGALLSD